MDTADPKPDPRFNALRYWLDGLGGFDLDSICPASADASFRRYFRVNAGSATYVVMDAPPDREDCGPFVRIAGYLQQMGLNAPQILRADMQAGFLLLTDLGSDQYLADLKKDPGLAEALYTDAIRALVTMQSRGAAYQQMLPPYDQTLLQFELSLFSDWLCTRHLGMRFDTNEAVAWQECCEFLLAAAASQPAVFVHRDYHSRNLMRVERNNPGILDFQDAVEGPLTYDLVSLLKDCYISWPTTQVRRWAMLYQQLSPQAQSLPEDTFLRWFELMGVQRQLKAAGIFARLNIRDGKTGYLQDIPRTLNYILELAPRYPQLEFVSRLVRDRVLPRLQESAG
jgi:aminoglycoside/choline kinase family phosphotransferase